MAKSRFNTPKEAKNWLSNRNVVVGHKTIERPKPQFAGLGVWGAIDYLVNHCGFALIASS